MIELLKYIISQIVDHPESLEIKEADMGNSFMQYNISADNDDVGKIIGKEGKIILAIRNISRILAIKEGKQIRIEIA